MTGRKYTSISSASSRFASRLLLQSAPLHLGCRAWCCSLNASSHHRASRHRLSSAQHHATVAAPHRLPSLIRHANDPLQAAKVARASARAAPSVTARFFVTTSRVSPSPPSVVLLAVVVSSVSQLVSQAYLTVASQHY